MQSCVILRFYSTNSHITGSYNSTWSWSASY